MHWHTHHRMRHHSHHPHNPHDDPRHRERSESGRFGDRRGGRRGGRMFDHGELRLVILALVAEQPRHGYEVIKAIEDRVGGSYSPSPGVVYPTLTMLEELGHATVSEDGGKKRYTITPAGEAELAANKEAADAALARLAEAGVRSGRAAAPPVIRAMENLKLALRLRMERGALTDAQLHAVAAALDAAAVAVERI